jgi:hypothetical protein
VDHADASREAAELDLDAGVGQRQNGITKLLGEDSRGLAERQELEQLGGGAAPVRRAIQEVADGIDEGVGRRGSVESREHLVGGAVEGGDGGQGPSEGGGVAGGG